MKNNIDSYKERVSNTIAQKIEYIEFEVESKSFQILRAKIVSFDGD